jgi:hypothetical protein
MSYKAILVHVETAAEARTKLAFDLARRHNALLIGLAATMWTSPAVYAAPEMMPLAPEMIEEARENVQRELKGASALFHKRRKRQPFERTGVRSKVFPMRPFAVLPTPRI